jgi:plasmid stabilization system protein ParE
VKTIPSTLGKPALVHVIRTDDPVWLERLLQTRFLDHRAGGEWFILDESNVALIRSCERVDRQDSLPDWLHGTDLGAFTQGKVTNAKHAASGTVTYRLSDKCRQMIRDIALWYKITDTASLEAAVRIFHQRGRPVATEAEVQAALAAIAPPPTEAPATGSEATGVRRKAGEKDRSRNEQKDGS